MKKIAKKTIILDVLLCLYHGSKNGVALKPIHISRFLNSQGIEISEKTVKRNIGYLISYGLPIEKGAAQNDGYYYNIKKDNFFNIK